MQIYKLLDGVTSTGSGMPVKIDPQRTVKGGPIPLLISGIIDANVILEATIASDLDVAQGNANWEPVENASWSANIADGLFTGFTHIRGNCTQYVSGTIHFSALI